MHCMRRKPTACASSRRTRRHKPGHASPRSGQALIETALTVAMISLIFFGLVQLSLVFTAQEVVDYAANKGARAATVGFDDFMIYKTVRVGTIPNAGQMITPDIDGGPLIQNEQELLNIPWYLSAQRWDLLDGILDYEDWDTVEYTGPVNRADGTVSVRVRQDYPLRMPFHRAYYPSDHAELEGDVRLDNHYTLYLDP